MQERFITLKSHQGWQIQIVECHLYLNTVMRQKCKKVGGHLVARHGITNYYTQELGSNAINLAEFKWKNEPSRQR